MSRESDDESGLSDGDRDGDICDANDGDGNNMSVDAVDVALSAYDNGSKTKSSSPSALSSNNRSLITL